MGMEPTALIQQLLKRGNYTHASLASAAGVSQPTITRIANGKSGCSRRTWDALIDLHAAHAKPKRGRK